MVHHELLVRPEPIEFGYAPAYDLDGTSVWRPDPIVVQAKHLRVTKTLSPAILRSCKQVYYEAFPILYGANYFKSDSYLGEKRWTGDFLRCIGKERAKDVRHLVIPMHEHSDRYENNAVRATSRGHFVFKLMAGLTGMHTLELEFGTWVLERPIDWIHLIDDQLRESRH
jgi:hypothetical protein